jgi:hypothetical protein
MGLEPTNLLTASQALYQLSYAPVAKLPGHGWYFGYRTLGRTIWGVSPHVTTLRGTLSGPELDLSFCREGSSDVGEAGREPVGRGLFFRLPNSLQP